MQDSLRLDLHEMHFGPTLCCQNINCVHHKYQDYICYSGNMVTVKIVMIVPLVAPLKCSPSADAMLQGSCCEHAGRT